MAAPDWKRNQTECWLIRPLNGSHTLPYYRPSQQIPVSRYDSSFPTAVLWITPSQYDITVMLQWHVDRKKRKAKSEKRRRLVGVSRCCVSIRPGVQTAKLVPDSHFSVFFGVSPSVRQGPTFLRFISPSPPLGPNIGTSHHAACSLTSSTLQSFCPPSLVAVLSLATTQPLSSHSFLELQEDSVPKTAL